jgi:AraC family transcriptional regulator, positive regulator of tynA and feaB
MTRGNHTARSFEQWLETLRSSCARYNAQCNDEQPFAGWVRPFVLGGIEGTDVGCHASAVDRTHNDIKLDGAEHFLVGQQLIGSAYVMQDARISQAEPGDIVLIDTSRPLQYRPITGTWNLLSLELPRRSCLAHLGFEPNVGVYRPDTLATQLLCYLFQSVRSELVEPTLRECELEIDLIVYDLIRALRAASWVRITPYSDRLFQRVCRIIRAHFTNPDFGPAEIATEVGISLRYLQKLFTCRGTTCSQCIQSLRLSHAYSLLARQSERTRRQSVSEVAWASGYRDRSYFHRAFLQRFGHSPGVSAARDEEPSSRKGTATSHRSKRVNVTVSPDVVTRSL